MVQIKGSAIKETIEQIRTRVSEEAFRAILGLLDEETRKVCEGEIFSSTWYPLDLFTRQHGLRWPLDADLLPRNFHCCSH